MGQSVCEDDGVEHVLAKMMDEWPGEGYDLARRNCCHFAEVINFFLLIIYFFHYFLFQASSAATLLR
jgi:hypothetical protein